MNPSSDIDLFTTTLPSPVLTSRMCSSEGSSQVSSQAAAMMLRTPGSHQPSRRHARRSRLDPPRTGPSGGSVTRSRPSPALNHLSPMRV